MTLVDCKFYVKNGKFFTMQINVGSHIGTCPANGLEKLRASHSTTICMSEIVSYRCAIVAAWRFVPHSFTVVIEMVAPWGIVRFSPRAVCTIFRGGVLCIQKPQTTNFGPGHD